MKKNGIFTKSRRKMLNGFRHWCPRSSLTSQWSSSAKMGLFAYTVAILGKETALILVHVQEDHKLEHFHLDWKIRLCSEVVLLIFTFTAFVLILIRLATQWMAIETNPNWPQVLRLSLNISNCHCRFYNEALGENGWCNYNFLVIQILTISKLFSIEIGHFNYMAIFSYPN